MEQSAATRDHHLAALSLLSPAQIKLGWLEQDSDELKAE